MRWLGRIFATVIVLMAGLAVSVLAIIKSTDVNEYRAVIAEQAKRLTGRDLVIEGQLEIAVSLRPSIVAEGVRLANAPWGSKPDMLSAGRLEARLDLLPLITGDIKIESLALIGPSILLEKDARGRGNWEFDVPDSARQAASSVSLSLPAVNRVILRDARIVFVDANAKRRHEFTVRSLDAWADSLDSPVHLDVSADAVGRRFEAVVQLGAINKLLSGTPYPISVEGVIAGASIRIQGTVGKPLEGRDLNLAFSAAGEDVRALADYLGLDVHIPPLGPYTAAGRLGDTVAGYSLEGLAVRVAGSDLGGNVNIALKGPRPKIEARLESSMLNLDPLLGNSDAKAVTTDGSQEQADGKRLVPDVAISTEALSKFDARIDYSARRLTYERMVVDDLNVVAVVEGGRATLTPLRGDIAGGRVSGGLVVDGRAFPLEVHLNLEGRQMGLDRLLRELAGDEFIEGGITDFRAELSGKGTTLPELMGGLKGNVRVTVGEGLIKNASIDLAGADLLGELIAGINPFTKKDKASILECAAARLTVENGVATADRGIGLRTEKMDVLGEGTINLGTEALDLRINTRARTGVGIGAGSVASLVRLQGTLAEPAIAVDPVKTAINVGTAVATGGLSLLAGALIDKIAPGDNPCKVALGLVADNKTRQTDTGVAPTAAPGDAEAMSAPKPSDGKADAGTSSEGGPAGVIKGIGRSIGDGLGKLLGR